VVAEELELAPEPLCVPEAEPEGCAEVELEAPPDDGCDVLEPAPAAPPLVEPELDGAALEDDEAPPLALSFFWMSTEVDEELEPELDGAGLGVAELPAPDGEVVLAELDAPAGARLLSARSQPVRTAAPNAMETASARVESFMWPPWLG
jgi:hypothetical protein